MKIAILLENEKILLLLTLFLCVILRFYKLGEIPAGFANDEGAITYQAYSILRTGKDTWGVHIPLLSFKDFGEFLPPFAVYALVPFLAVLGVSEFVSRTPFALTSALSIIPIYILVKSLTKNNKTALLSCLLFSLSPFNIGWSRFVYEGNFGMLFYLLGLMFWSLSLKKLNYILASLAFFGLTLTTYHIYFFVTPITVALLYLPRIRNIGKLNKRIFAFTLALTLSIATYYLLIVSSGSGRERFRQVSIFSNANILHQVNTKRSACKRAESNFLCRLFINKYMAYTNEYFHNYLFHLSPTYLALNATFLRGTILPPHGIIYPFELLFVYLSIAMLLMKRNITSFVFLSWLFIYPAANSFSGVGEISRITHAMPLFPILSALGIQQTWQFASKARFVKYVLIIFSVIFIFNITNFLFNYFVVFPETNSKNGSYAYVQLFKKLKDARINYERIFVTSDYTGGSPQYQARIFLPVDPGAFQDSSRHVLTIKKPQNYFDYTRLDNLYLPAEIDKINYTQEDLVVVSPNEKKQTDTVLFDIKEPTGEISLYAVIRESQ